MQVQSSELDINNCIKWFDYHKEKYPGSFFDGDKFFMVACRGHYLDSSGKKGANDINLYDDLIIGINLETRFYMAVKGNTDPSFYNKKLAKLKAGVIRYYRGNHKGEYLAFRPYPEGVKLPCTRDGVSAFCSHTNCHGGKDVADGIGYDTWSEGCLTMPITFFKSTFQPKCYEQIERFHQTIDPKHRNDRYQAELKKGLGTKHFPLILLEKKQDADGKQRIYSATGEYL